jgi:hypothetical protein
MGLFRSLSLIALRQVTAGAAQAAGLAGAEGVAGFLTDRFTDHSQRLVIALRSANERAWQALEVALAGESLWNKLDDADDKAFRQQVRVFLDATPLEGLPAQSADDLPRSSADLSAGRPAVGGGRPAVGASTEFRQLCLRELRAARRSGLLLADPLRPDDLAKRAADFTRFDDPAALLEREGQALDGVAGELREAGHASLARLVSLRPADGPPLLVRAVRFFFRRFLRLARKCGTPLAPGRVTRRIARTRFDDRV